VLHLELGVSLSVFFDSFEPPSKPKMSTTTLLVASLVSLGRRIALEQALQVRIIA